MQFYQFNFPYKIETPQAMAYFSTKLAIITDKSLLIYTRSFILLKKIPVKYKFNTINFLKEDTILLGGDCFVLYDLLLNTFTLLSDTKSDCVTFSPFDNKTKILFFFSYKNVLYEFIKNENKNNIELKKKFGTQINSIIKDNKFIVVGEESGSITFLKKDTLFDIKIQSPVHKISFLEKVDDVKYLLVTDKNGFAYILNNNKILFTIKVRDSFVYGIGNVNHIYFAGYDNRITLFNKINDEYVKVFQKDYHTSEIISFIKKGKRCLALSKDGIFSEESHGYVSKMTLFPKEVKYFNDLLIYKENNDLHFYKFDKERKKETNKENIFSFSDELLFNKVSFLNINNSYVNYLLRMKCKEIINFDFLNDSLTYSDSKNTYLFKYLNNKVLLIDTLKYSLNHLLFSDYVVLINDKISFYDIKNMKYSEKILNYYELMKYDKINQSDKNTNQLNKNTNTNQLNTNTFIGKKEVLKSDNFLLIGNTLLNKSLNRVELPVKGLIHSFKEYSGLIYFLVCDTYYKFTLYEYKVKKDEKFLYQRSLEISNTLIKDFVIHDDLLYYCDELTLYSTPISSLNTSEYKLEECIDSLHFCNELIVSHFDFKRSVKDLSKGAEKNKYGKK